MTSVGFVAALPGELRCLLSARPEGCGLPLTVPGGGMAVLAGLGRERAEDAAWSLVRAGVSGLVSWGTAGGLDPGLEPGTLVVAHVVVEPDGGRLEGDPGWARSAIDALDPRLARVRSGTVAWCPRILEGPMEKARLARDTGALAVDMESGGIARVARRAGIPFLALRVVLDPASSSVPPAARLALAPDGDLRPGVLTAALLRRPGDLPALVRLGLRFRTARRTLRRVARAHRDSALRPPGGGA